MAPPSGPRGGATSTTTRNTRSNANGARGSSHGGGRGRGGIAKRGRSSAPRVDRDGDLVMDPNASTRSGAGANKSSNSAPRRGTSRPNGASRSSAPNKSNSRLQQNIVRHLGGDTSQIPRAPSSRISSNNTTLKVFGLKTSRAATNPDGGVKDLLLFLEKKATNIKNANGTGRAPRPVLIKKSLPKGDYVYIMASNEDAEEILKVSNFSFAGSVLVITKSEDGWPGARTEQAESTIISSEAKQHKLQLQSVLERRYNIASKLLDLSALGQDPTLIEMGIFSSSSDTAEKVFKVFMVICQSLFKTPQQKREAIESVSLAGNNVDSVDQIFDLAETFPDLKHLDLSNNQFSALRQLNKWRGRFRHLETLLLTNNPIIQAEPGHAIEILDWFPKLQNLSNVIVRTPEQIAAAQEAAKVKEIPQKGTDFRDVAGLGEAFLRQFFALYDSNRDQLLASFYDEFSTFTISVVQGVPKEKDTPVLPWAPYLEFSRNHQRITTEAARFQRYYRGVKIQGVWGKLPRTQHPDLVTNLDKYIIDCHPMKGLHDPANRKFGGEDGMIITMHGEFDELQADGRSGKRSFSRTFVLGPPLPSRGTMRVISDMLSLHAYNPVPNVTNPVSNTTAPIAVPATIPIVAPQSSPEEQKQMMMIELSKRTSMTAEYSKMCLDGAEWNFDRAIAIFEEKKAALPAEAFIQP